MKKIAKLLSLITVLMLVLMLAACNLGSTAVESVSLDTTSKTLTVDESFTLNATVEVTEEGTDKTVNWSSSKSNVASVDMDGKVTAKAAGTTTITAASKANSSKKATCEITVVAAVIPPMEPIEFSGTGDKVINGIDLQKGNYYAELTHDGLSNFIVKFYYGSGEYNYVSLANKIGQYSGQSLLDDVLGKVVTAGSLEVKASGDWTVTIHEVSGTCGKTVSGFGDTVTGLISGLSGRKAISMSHDGSRNFIAKIYKFDGGQYGYDSLANKIGEYNGEVSVSFTSGSDYFISVQADGNWTFAIS